MAETPQGLQDLIDYSTAYLLQCGLKINQAKAHTVSIVGSGKKKKMAVDVRQTITIDGLPIRVLVLESRWMDLPRDLVYSLACRPTANLKSKFVPLLDRLTKASLKPQQRLFALKVFLPPKVYHRMVLGRVTINSLSERDKAVRGFVRQWLALPNDTPAEYFHAPLAEGGLGIPSLRWIAPLQSGKD